MKKCRICGREFEPSPLPPSPIKVMLNLPDPWEEICPYCGIKFVAEISKWGVSFIDAWREQRKRESQGHEDTNSGNRK